jgi:hypothetical protein
MPGKRHAPLSSVQYGTVDEEPMTQDAFGFDIL